MVRIGQLHPELAARDVLVGDRAFCSFAHLALLLAQKAHGLFRIHQRQIVDFRPHRRAASKRSRKKGETGRPTSRWLKRLGKHDQRSEEHTSELQSHLNLVCRLLLEKKKKRW